MFFWNSVCLESSERRQFDLCFPCLFPTQLVPPEVHHSVRFSSVSQSCLTLSHLMGCSTPGLPVHQELSTLLRLMSIQSMIPSSHLILCCPHLLLPSVFPSIRVFSNESTLCIKWPKYSSFNVIISPSNEHSLLIPFRFDWFDLLEVQGTRKSLLQYHS